MPEIGFSEANKLSVSKDSHFPSDEQLLAQIENDPDLAFVGEGVESIVVSTKSKPERVMAISYFDLSPQEARQEFYVHRIFSTLFPHNFPHFYAALGSWDVGKNPEGNTTLSTGTVRERIVSKERRKLSLPEIIIRKLTNNPQVKFPLSKAWREFEKMHIDLDHFLDTEWGALSENTLLGEDGGEYYIDKIKPSGLQPFSFNEDTQASILKYMNDKGYSDIQKKIVETSLSRLDALGVENK